LTRDIARRYSEVASEEAERNFNKKATPHSFLPDQLVLLDEHSFLAKIKNWPQNGQVHIKFYT
jgi:hypothetical protein